MRLLWTVVLLFFALLAGFAVTAQILPAPTPPPGVLTRSYGNLRTGANLAETVLTPASLQVHGLHQLLALQLADDARGTEGQPLIVPGLTMADGRPHNILFTATMADDVYAFDVDTGVLLWKQRIGSAIPNSRALDMWGTQGSWGILSTPVINPATATLYVVTMTSTTGQIGQAKFFLHALSLTNGADQATPLDLDQATYTAPTGRTSTVGSVPRKQRCGLLFDSRGGHDTVFITMGSFVEDADTNQGWIIAVDVDSLRSPAMAAAQPTMTFGAAITTTSRYSGAGVWMAGQGPAMDAAGDLYLVTGNGGFDGITDFGNAVARLHYTPPPTTSIDWGHTDSAYVESNVLERPSLKPAVSAATNSGSLAFTQWLAPFDDTGRVGADPTLADTSLIPTGGYANMPGGASNMDSPKDEDLGSAGALLIPAADTGYAKNVVVAAGKDGILYTLDADNMGNNHPADFAPALIAQNVYAKMLALPYGFTFYPGAMNLAPTNLASLQTTEFGYSHHQHSTPAYYHSPTIGPELITGGENGPVRAFTFGTDFRLTYQAQGGDYASAGMPPPGGMPGSMISLSANGSVPNTCIIWATQPVGDANKTVTPGYLVAYACDRFAAGALVKLWDSREHGIGFTFTKFQPPIVWNGKVIVTSYDGRILVLGQ